MTLLFLFDYLQLFVAMLMFDEICFCDFTVAMRWGSHLGLGNAWNLSNLPI